MGDGDVVKLGRILRDECADPHLSLVDVAARIFENNLIIEAPTLLELTKTLGIKFVPEHWEHGADERFGNSKEHVEKLGKAEPFRKLLTTAQKVLLREHFVFFKKHGDLLYMVEELSKEDKAELPKEEGQKRAFWAPFIEDQDSATVSLHDLFKWLVTLTWAWEEDSVLDKRTKEDRGDVRVDVLPLIAFDKKTVVDAVSGRT